MSYLTSTSPRLLPDGCITWGKEMHFPSPLIVAAKGMLWKFFKLRDRYLLCTITVPSGKNTQISTVTVHLRPPLHYLSIASQWRDCVKEAIAQVEILEEVSFMQNANQMWIGYAFCTKCIYCAIIRRHSQKAKIKRPPSAIDRDYRKQPEKTTKQNQKRLKTQSNHVRPPVHLHSLLACNNCRISKHIYQASLLKLSLTFNAF